MKEKKKITISLGTVACIVLFMGIIVLGGVYFFIKYKSVSNTTNNFSGFIDEQNVQQVENEIVGNNLAKTQIKK